MTDDRSLHVDPATATASLAQADAHTAAAVRQARWWVLYMAVFAVSFGALTVLVGSADGPRDLVAPMVAFLVLVVSMAALAVARPVQGGFPRRVYVGGWVGTGLAYGAALLLGLTLDFPLTAWVVAGVLVATPLAVAAWLTHRALR